MTGSNITVSVGGTLDDDGAAFIGAWERAERGEVFQERQLAFQSWSSLTTTLTAKRYDLLRYVHRHPVTNVATLARALNRNYRRVHEDVEALTAAGFLDRDGSGVRADYDRISTQITI